MSKSLKTIYTYMAENHPEIATDIYYGLEMVQSTIEDSVKKLKSDMHIAIDNEDNYDNLSDMLKLSKELLKEINNYLQELAFIENTFSEDDEILDEPITTSNEKICSLTNDFTSKKVCSITFKDKKYIVKNYIFAQIKLCDILYELNKEKFMSMLNEPFIKSHINPVLNLNNTGSKYRRISVADIYLWTNTPSRDKTDFICNALKYYGISAEDVQIGIRTDYDPKKREIKKKREKDAPTVSDMKIGAYVKEKMLSLEKRGYQFSNEMLAAMLSKELSKKLIGVNLPLLLKYDESIDISQQDISSSGQRRYWKTIFTFNGEKYLITSQWFEYNREGFDKWFNGLR